MPSLKLDLYKKFAADYATPRKPSLVKPHAAQYLSIEGRGEPGGTEFVHRLGCLYNIAFTIKMTNKFAGRDYALAVSDFERNTTRPKMSAHCGSAPGVSVGVTISVGTVVDGSS